MLILSLFILTLLIAATIFVKFQLSINHSSERLNNQKRIRTWWTIFFLCVPAIYIGGWAFTLLVYGIIYWVAFEISRLQNIQLNIFKLILFTISIISYDISMTHFQNWINLFLLFPIIILTISVFFTTSKKLRSVLLLIFSVTAIQSLQLISQLGDKFNYDSSLIILFLFFITSVNDIIQYLCGKLFGKKQLAPKLSPNKTIEGALGGLFFTSLIFSFTLPLILNVTWFIALSIGLFISILGIIGDLNFSSYKRHANVNESGSSLPGHGGLLDRIDSLTLTAPGFGLCLNLVN